MHRIPQTLRFLAAAGLLLFTPAVAAPQEPDGEEEPQPPVVDPEPGPGPEEPEPEAQELQGPGPVETLLARLEGPEALRRDVIVGHIAALGPKVLPEVLRLLAGDERGDVPEGASLAAAPAGERTGDGILMDVLGMWPRRTVVAGVVGGLDQEAGTEERLAALRLLGRLGEGTLEGVLDAVLPVDPVQLRGNTSKRVTDALVAALAEDDLAHVALGQRVDQLPPGLAACVARALARGGRTRDVELLTGLLDRDEELDEVVLGELANLRVRRVTPAIEQGAELVRTFLDHPEPRTRKLAALVLGRLHDAASIEGLIMLLEDPDRTVGQAALWALRELSGTSWPGEPGRWRSWYAQERAWLAAEAPELASQLAGEDVSAAVRAARQLGTHALFRKRVTQHLESGLDNPYPSVQLASCHALQRIGGLRAAPRLVKLLLSVDEEVRGAAQGALEALTGAQLGTDPESWLEWLGG